MPRFGHSAWRERRGLTRVLSYVASGLLVVNSIWGSLGGSVEVLPADPDGFVKSFQLETWTVDDGLPQNTVLDVAQGSDGYLWVGTVFGLARFDGVHFEVYDRDRIDSLPNDVITAAYASPSGGLCWGTQNGLVEVKDGHAESLGAAQTLLSQHVLEIAPRSEGGVWMLTHNDGGGVTAVERTGVEPLAAQFVGQGPFDLVEDGSGFLWISESRGVSRIELASKEQKVFELGDGSSGYGIMVNKDGEILVGGEGEIYRFVNENWEKISLVGVLENQTVHGLTEDREGAVWASCPNGVGRLLGGRWRNYPLPERFTKNRCSEVFQDAGGDYWFGSRDNGLHRIRHPLVGVITSDEGLSHDSIWSLTCGNEGEIWVGTGGGLSLWNGREIDVFGFEEGIPRPWVTTVYHRRNDELWFGMRTGGTPAYADAPFVGRLKDEKVELFRSDVLSEVSRVWVIYEDGSGRTWVGAREGLFTYHGGGFDRFVLGPDDRYRDVRVIAEDQDGKIWIGTNGAGLCRVDDGEITIFDGRSGLSHLNVWAIHIDLDGVLWVGTESGLNRIEDEQIYAYDRSHGLFDDLVNQILEDDFGNLWLSCNRGVYRVKKKELEAVRQEKESRVEYVLYGAADGMLSAETNGECQPAGCRLPDGRLAFPTGRGIAVFNPVELLSESHAPRVVLERIEANGREVFSNGIDRLKSPVVPELAPGDGRVIEFDYTANAFVAPGKVRFQYRLLGQHDDWIDAGARRTAHYINLRPGEYEFQVRAVNYQGVWNREGAHIAFVLKPHYYQMELFWAAVVLFLACLLWAIHRSVVLHRVRVAHLEDQVQLDQERSRIARDMHDEIGASLTEISMLSELAKLESGGEGGEGGTLSKIKNRSRGLVESVDEIVWATNPKHDTLESFVAYFGQFANEFLRNSGLLFKVKVPSPSELPSVSLSSDKRHHLFLASKEVLSNVIRHSKATEVKVRCEVSEVQRFSVTIEDNGIGLQSTSGQGKRGGNGIDNIKRRMRLVAGDSQFEDRREGGLSVQLWISLSDND